MLKIYMRCLGICLVCQLLIGPRQSLAIEDWEPISLAAKVGSGAASFVYQPAAKGCHPLDDPQGVEVEASYERPKSRSCTNQRAGGKNQRISSENDRACSKAGYFPRGRRCQEWEENAISSKFEWVTVKDGKIPYALEFEIGQIKFDDTPTPDAEDDVGYAALAGRRFIWHDAELDRLRFYAGAGVGYYRLHSDRQWGLNARFGAEFGINPDAKRKGKLYVALELEITHHHLRSGLDTTGVLVGVRFHRPKKNAPTVSSSPGG